MYFMNLVDENKSLSNLKQIFPNLSELKFLKGMKDGKLRVNDEMLSKLLQTKEIPQIKFFHSRNAMHIHQTQAFFFNTCVIKV
jgi:hypothetical protein